MKSRRSLLAAPLLAVLASPLPARAADDYISIATGALGGVYYPAGRAICSYANKLRAQTGTNCAAVATPGSIYNVEKLADGELEFAIVQSDVQFDAVKGEGPWRGQPTTALRSVMSLYPELLAIVVHRDGPVKTLDDLQGRRVNIGNPGSGTRATWERLRAALGWEADAIEATELPPAAANQAFCEGDLDAVMIAAGHPSPQVEKALIECQGVLVPVEGPAVDKLVASAPYYGKGMIRRSSYGGQADVPSFGDRATLVTRASVADEDVSNLVHVIVGNLDALRHTNRSLGEIDKESLVSAGSTAPLHPGAERAYRDLGLLK
ncbi:MAG: TAXI family TRAP transporter solute-binding subunit [Geminicoccaceae bacterium]